MALTKVTGGTISTTSDYQINNIVGVAGTFTTLNVSGVLTYEDVTNIESVGVATFKDDVNFNGTGAGISSVFWDKSANEFKFKDGIKLSFGDSQDLSIYHDGSSWIKNTTGNLTLNSNTIHLKDGGNNKSYLRTYTNDRVELYFNNSERLRTTGTGVNISNDLNVAGVSTFIGETNIGTGGTVFTALVGAAASVGIGSALPDYMLDVAGAINSETDIKVQGVSVSDTALNDAVAMAIALG